MDMVDAVPVIGSWNTRPRYAALLCSGSLVMSVPSTMICPESTYQAPAMAFSVVDFPAPFPPMIVTKSPGFRFRFTPSRAFFSLIVPLLNVLLIFLISSIYPISYAPFLTAQRPFRYGTARNTATTSAEKSFI